MRQGRRVNAEDVLQIRTDICVGVVDRRRSSDPLATGDALYETVCGDSAGWRIDDDIRAERELRVDPSLLVVGRREDPEIDTEREEQPDWKQPAVERVTAPARAGEEEPERRPGPAARRSLRQPLE